MQEGISLLSSSCGTLRLREPEVLGQGEFEVEWYTDGETAFPAVRGLSEDARLDGLRMEAELLVHGANPLTVHGLPTHTDSAGDGSTSEIRGVGVFGRAGEAALVLGAVSAKTSQFRIGTTADGSLEANWATGMGGRLLADGEVFYFDPVAAAFGPDVEQLWSGHVGRVAKATGGRSVNVVDASGWIGAAPQVNEWDEVLDGLAASTVPSASERVAVLTANGDGARWDPGTLQGAVEQGMAATFSQERGRDILVGVRWSPFTETVQRATGEGWVLDTEGELLVVDGLAFVDVTHKRGREQVLEGARAIGELGLEWVEVDHLWAAAVDGVRVGNLTPQEAFGEGMRLIRNEPLEKNIVGLAVPMLESAGVIDGLRLTRVEPAVDVDNRVMLGPTHGVLWSLLTEPVSANDSGGWSTGGGLFALWASVPGGLWLGSATELKAVDVDPRYPSWLARSGNAMRYYRQREGATDVGLVEGDGFAVYLNGSSNTVVFPITEGVDYWSGEAATDGQVAVEGLDGQVWVVSGDEFR